MLDAISSELWLRADGKTTLRVIARDMAGWSRHSVSAMLLTIPMLLVILSSEGVMYQLDHPADLPYHLTLPQEDQNAEQMRASMMAAGWLDE
jgi:hypothetical protein